VVESLFSAGNAKLASSIRDNSTKNTTFSLK
jgi:hypothetical protein